MPIWTTRTAYKKFIANLVITKSNVSHQSSRRRNTYYPTVITKESFSSPVVIHNYYCIYICWCFTGLPHSLRSFAMTTQAQSSRGRDFSSPVVIHNYYCIYICWCFNGLPRALCALAMTISLFLNINKIGGHFFIFVELPKLFLLKTEALIS